MGHVQDRWWKDVGKDDRGRPIREKTELHGNGMRYRVRYLDPNGRERSQSFPDRQKSAAEAFLHEVETDKNKSSYLDRLPGASLSGGSPRRGLPRRRSPSPPGSPSRAG